MATGQQRQKRRGRPSIAPEKAKRYSVGIRTTKELKDLLQSAADSAGRSVAQEIEFRLERSLDRRSALDEAFDLAFGARAGLVRFLGDIVRRGGGSRALIRALERLAIPDLTANPDDLAKREIWDAGYDNSDLDPDQAARAAAWRERLGSEIAGLAIAAYRRLREEVERDRTRKPLPDLDPGLAKAFARAAKRS